jgi:hypothetical protein
MKLHLQTQYKENYGAHNWDGEGECPQRWKFKGGIDYMIPLPYDMPSKGLIQMITELAVVHVERKNYYCEEYVIHWEVVPDDYLTYEEKQQLEWEGCIEHPARRLTLREIGMAV